MDRAFPSDSLILCAPPRPEPLPEIPPRTYPRYKPWHQYYTQYPKRLRPRLADPPPPPCFANGNLAHSAPTSVHFHRFSSMHPPTCPSQMLSASASYNCIPPPVPLSSQSTRIRSHHVSGSLLSSLHYK